MNRDSAGALQTKTLARMPNALLGCALAKLYGREDFSREFQRLFIFTAGPKSQGRSLTVNVRNTDGNVMITGASIGPRENVRSLAANVLLRLAKGGIL